MRNSTVEASLNDNGCRERLQNLILKLECGENVPTREIKKAITADERKRFEATTGWNPAPPKIPRAILTVLKEYVALLKIADLLDVRASGRRSVENSKIYPNGLYRKRPLYRQAESAYCNAVEYLEQLVANNPGILVWLDRPVSFDQNGEYSATPDPEGIPRLMTSRSQHARALSARRQQKRESKIVTLQNSLVECQFDLLTKMNY